jgi:putative tryptophan/tyrosine transport system substrate-binding protein
MRRREFIQLVGSTTATWPLAASAQQPALSVIGFLSARSPGESAGAVKAFRLGLSEGGFVEGQNLVISFRWAEGHYDRLQALASELVAQSVAAIAAFGGDPPVRAAKAATSTIPIVFTTGTDPVADGLVASLNRPGGNATGVSFFSGQLGEKLVELLHSVVPNIKRVAVFINRTSPQGEVQARDVQNGARKFGIGVDVFNVGNEQDIETAFATVVQNKTGGLVVTADAFFTSERDRLVALATRNTVPIISPYREFAVAGALMSYGASLLDAYRQAGIYVGKVLKGERPAELPIMQPTKFELVINSKAAKTIGLEVSPTMLAIADEVIE